MKKKTIALLLLLTALLSLVGLLNRSLGKSSETAAGSGAASEETSSEAAGNTDDETAWLTRSYPEKSIEFNAMCPTQTEATTLPLTTAQLDYDVLLREPLSSLCQFRGAGCTSSGQLYCERLQRLLWTTRTF